MLKNYFWSWLGTSLSGGLFHLLTIFTSFGYVGLTLTLLGLAFVLYIIGFIFFVILLYKLAKYVDKKAKKST